MRYHAPVDPKVMAAPSTARYLRAVAADVPELGHVHAEAIVSHGYTLASLSYAGRYDEVWAFGRDYGWTDQTTQTIARHALTILLPVAISLPN